VERPREHTVADLWRRWASAPSTRVDKHNRPVPPTAEERLAHVRAARSTTNLIPLVDDWHKVLVGPAGGVSRDTADHYRAAVRGYVLSQLAQLGIERWKDVPPDAALHADRLTEALLTVHVEEMDDVEPATVRKRGQGLRRFTAWLVGRRVLGVDPMEHVPLPAPGDPLCHYLETEEAKRLADAQAGQYRLLGYLLPGSAIEVSVALALRARDVAKDSREIRAAGTKTYNRDRVVRVADYAWDAVLELLKGRHPDSLLFDRIPHRWAARDAHAEAVASVAAKGHGIYVTPKPYTMRDHRHTWAVRAVRSGWPIEAVARQLGHVNGVLALKCYGRFVPTSEERDKWEKMATARDEQMGKERSE
jgi:integrase